MRREQTMNRRILTLVNLIAICLATASCGILPEIQDSSEAKYLVATNEALEQTLSALEAQGTKQAEQAELDALAQAMAETPTPLVITATSEPTLPPTPTLPAEDTPTPLPPTPDAVMLTNQMQARIRAANVLAFDLPDEDGRLLPRMGHVLDGMGFSGGLVVNAGDSLGTFDRHLRNSTWDLVILSVESRQTVQLGKLGLAEPLMNHVSNGGALIVETWNLDEDQSSTAGFLMSLCNARVEKDWHRPEGTYNPMLFAIQARDQDSPIFNKPNRINLPIGPTVFWKGDAGDLIAVQPDGGSQILAGLAGSNIHNYGYITSCNKGKFILQTFSSHDYPLFETVHLYQNYIDYVLTNRFNEIAD